MNLTPDWFKGKKVTVMGLGLHGGGLGTAKWLVTQGAIVTVTDMKGEKELAPSVRALQTYASKLQTFKPSPYAEASGDRPNLQTFPLRRSFGGQAKPQNLRLVLGRHEEADFADADMVLRNPAVPRGNKFLELAEKNGVPVESDISLFFHLCPFPIAAITGTKGKTTVTTLLAEICALHDRRTVVGGNIRINPLDALDRLRRIAAGRQPKAPPVVLELSSWQLESLEKHRVSAHVAVVTNIKEDHLNRYDGIEDYARAKELNVMFQKPDDAAVLNADDPRVVAMAKPGRGRITWFSTKPLKKGMDGCFARVGKAILRDGGKETTLFPLSIIKVPGIHNIGNVLAAVCAACAMGISPAIIRRGVRAFRGAPGRLQEIAMKHGVRFVNDTTATMPDASSAALRALAPKKGKKTVLIAGGADKSLRFDDWAKDVGRYVKYLVLFDGTARPKIDVALAASAPKTPAVTVASMKEAVRLAVAAAKRGDIVLLSPACASFGLFQHEFDRGDQFERAVQKLK